MKKYTKTRPQASAESIRRVKTELYQITPCVHPFFLSKDLFPELVAEECSDTGLKDGLQRKQEILQQIRNWRPNQVFLNLKFFI